MAMGIFEQLAWLTKKVNALCCIVKNGGGGVQSVVECIDISSADVTITQPGQYEIIGAGSGFGIIIPDPASFPGRSIVLINRGNDFSVPVSCPQGIFYESTSTFITQVNAYSVYEIVSVYSVVCSSSTWRSKCIKPVVTREGVDLGGLTSLPLYVGVDGGGLYIIETAGIFDGVSCIGQSIIFPNPAHFNGQRIVIINRDVTCFANIDLTYAPVDVNLIPLTQIGPSETFEFMATNGYWWIINQN